MSAVMNSPFSSANLLSPDIPDGRALVNKGRSLAREILPKASAASTFFGHRSEEAYRRAMAANGDILTFMNIGMKTWRDTRDALTYVYEALAARGIRVDRANLICDRRLGLPPSHRNQAPKETGPLLTTQEEWDEVAQTVPIWISIGDYMINSPNAVSNVSAALAAGIQTIGNLSAFAWRFPNWSDDVAQVASTVTALGMMSQMADLCLTISYLDDGYCASFKDYSSYIGWAMLEHYIADLCGAKLGHSYGGLTHDPIMKSAVAIALDGLRQPNSLNNFIHGNTTRFTTSAAESYGVMVPDMLWMMMTQLHLDRTTMVLPIPITEASRIPTKDELVNAHITARRVEEFARVCVDLVDWSPIHATAANLTSRGRVFADSVLGSLRDSGVNVTDPAQLLLALRRIGAVQLEVTCGAPSDPAVTTLTDTYRATLAERSRLVEKAVYAVAKLPTFRALVASTDIHEYAYQLLKDVVIKLGGDIVDGGLSVDPSDLGALALEADVDLVLLTTHNGMALTYVEMLLMEMERVGRVVPVIVGGILNQDSAEEGEAPVDVTRELQERGVITCSTLDDVLVALPRVVHGTTATGAP